MPIHLAHKGQIVLLVNEKVQISSKYLDFLDVFLEEKVSILPKVTNLNQYAIENQGRQSIKDSFSNPL